MTIASASATEVEYLVRLCHELDLVDDATYRELSQLATSARRSILAYRKKLLTPAT
jgi:four helix bundle protein